MQPRRVYKSVPTSTGDLPSHHRDAFSSHFSYSPEGWTTAFASMSECFVPQYSAHTMSNSPACVALNHNVVYRPGTTSIFVRNAGMNKLWMTSSDIIVSLIFR